MTVKKRLWAKNLVAALVEATEELHDDLITHAQFQERNRLLWKLASETPEMHALVLKLLRNELRNG